MKEQQEIDWSMLFGKTEQVDASAELSFDAQELLKSAPDVNRLIQESLGKNLLESIDFFENLLKTTARNRQIKQQAQSTLLAMKQVASHDITLLAGLHAIIFSTSLSFYHEDLRKYAQQQLVDALEGLIRNQAKKLKSIHFPILFKSHELLRRNAINSFYNVLLEHAKKKEYQVALNGILTLHLPIEPLKKAKEMYQKIEHVTKSQREGVMYFLAVLKKRLISTHYQTPASIDYTSLKHEVVAAPQQLIKPLNIDYESSIYIKQESDKVRALLTEAGLKEHYSQLILPEIQKLVESARTNHH